MRPPPHQPDTQLDTQLDTQPGARGSGRSGGGVSKALLTAIAAMVLFLGAPLLSLAVLATMSENATEQKIADCLAQQAALGWRPDGAVGAGALRVAQANIKTSLSPAKAAADLRAVYATGADLVSLNETNRRHLDQLRHSATPGNAGNPGPLGSSGNSGGPGGPGYAVYRDPSASGQARSTAVAWRTDRWRRSAAGRVRIVATGPQKWDAGRSA
ncbi:MAG: hypothetical protein WA966_10985, partial [Ornithinimicrobium sp.]